jgi:ABC-type lipoprotein release transport system permease subunit
MLIALTATWGLTTSDATWVRGFEYGVPWGEVAIIVALAVGAALIAAVLPARTAADIRPAVALRLAE